MSAIFQARTVTAAQISDATSLGRSFLVLNGASNMETFLYIDDAGDLVPTTAPDAMFYLAGNNAVAADGTVSPVNSISTVNGVPTAIS